MHGGLQVASPEWRRVDDHENDGVTPRPYMYDRGALPTYMMITFFQYIR
jgi:hypothetical protein